MIPDALCLVWLCITPRYEIFPLLQIPGTALDASPTPSSASFEALPVLPVAAPQKPEYASGVEWTSLAKSSLRFLGVMHAFRWATESDTRAGGIGWGSGYRRAVGNLHGWADGDPY